MAMVSMVDIKSLTAEVQRIVSAPYVVSLQELRLIVGTVNKASLQRWAHGHPCQVNALAKAVIDGLQLWTYVVSLLGDLCHVVTFRNAVLQLKPTLLDHLLRKAVESQHGYELYFTSCVSMLAAPLPNETPIPASTPPFFLKVLEEAVRAPSALTIRPIYLMLVGLGPALLDVLPEGAVARFQEQLIRMLRSLDDQSTNLLCLAIFARITTKPCPQSSTAEISSQESLSASGTALPARIPQHQTIQQFFGQKRAPKTLDLVVLRVIFACSNSSSLTSDDALESLKLAKEIIDAVERQQKDEWLKSNGSKIRKFFEKVLRKGICPELQALAFEVIVSMVKSEDLPVQLVKAYQDLIRIEHCSSVSDESGAPASRCTIESFAPRLDEAFIAEILHSVLMTAVRKSLPCDQFLKASQNATLIVSAMATAVQGSSKLRTEILFVLSSNRLRQPLQELQAIAPSSMRDSEEGCADHEICPTSLAETQRGLRLRICSLFLETALLASPDQAGMDTALAISLLQKQVEFSPPIPACAYGSRYSHGVGKSSLPIAEQTYTTDQDRASADWRTRLSSDLLQEATTRSDMILRKVGEICRDLEDRCKMVEQPLAEEQGRSKALIILLQTSRARVAELESQAEQRSLLFKGIDADKAELQSQVQAGERRLKELSDVLENVESKLEEANAEVERSDTAAKEAAYDHDLKHRAIMSTKDETIDEQTELIAQLEGELEGLRKQHAATSQAESIAQDKVVALEARLVEITHTVEAEKTSNIQKESEIEQLRSIETKLRSEIGVLNNKMEQGVRRIEALQSEVQSANASSDETMEKLGMLRESDKLVATEEVARLRHAHGAEIRKLHANVQEATQIAASESREKDLRVSELERKVERFRNEREVKAKEFAEVQDLSRKLMAVMGRRTEQSVHLTSDKITSETSEPSVDTPVGQQAIHRLRTAKSSQLFESSTSSKSSPTSKRTRPRRNAKTPSLQQAKIDLGAKTVKTAHNAMSPSPRRPLEDVGVNIYNLSPVKTQQHVGTKGREGLDREMSVASQYDALMEIGDLSFSGSDVFTSTERQRSPAPHHSSRTELYDETTADFQ